MTGSSGKRVPLAQLVEQLTLNQWVQGVDVCLTAFVRSFFFLQLRLYFAAFFLHFSVPCKEHVLLLPLIFTFNIIVCSMLFTDLSY